MDQHDPILARLLDLHPKKIDLSLGRVERLLARSARRDQRLPPIIHVAGTNGKGSTLAFMRAIWRRRARGSMSTRRRISCAFNERIRLRRKAAANSSDDADLAQALALCETRERRRSRSLFLKSPPRRRFILFARHAGGLSAARSRPWRAVDATNVITRRRRRSSRRSRSITRNSSARRSRRSPLRESRRLQARRAGDHRLSAGRARKCWRRGASDRRALSHRRRGFPFDRRERPPRL